MLRFIKYFLLALFLPIFLLGQDTIDGIAAIVADKIILRSDVFQVAQMTAMQQQIDISRNPSAITAFQENALEGLIIKNLLIARAKVDSLDEVDESRVDAQLDQQIENMLIWLIEPHGR